MLIGLGSIAIALFATRAAVEVARVRSGEDRRMTRVAVIAHRGKTVGGGLPELRRVLEERGVSDVFWREVGKSKLRARAGARRRSIARPS